MSELEQAVGKEKRTTGKMKKTVKAVEPYRYKNYINFKLHAYEAWKNSGGKTASSHYVPGCMKGLFFNHELPTICTSKNEARLRFVEAVSIKFDTFPDYSFYEIIPFIWDCWPRNYDRMERWIKKHDVRTAFFTSSEEMRDMKKRVPSLIAMHCPEAVDSTLFSAGRCLAERHIDLLEFGRSNNNIIPKNIASSLNINHVTTNNNNKFIFSDTQLREIMSDSKLVISLPRIITFPEAAEGIETLTQRYWENMLSRNVMIGHAPKELVDLIGYNPVIELESFDMRYVADRIQNVLEHIADYQELVDKNRETALKLGDWSERMTRIKFFLVSNGYCL